MKCIISIMLLSIITACGNNAVVLKPTPCTTKAVSNGVSVNCPDGTNSFVANGSDGASGISGSNGSDGQNGLDGSNGINGTNGTVITSIQLCNGITPSYPSTFPEVALCIDNQLYAVYSANDGFLVLLTPGVYSSNGINASCTFTVGQNCGVSQ